MKVSRQVLALTVAAAIAAPVYAADEPLDVRVQRLEQLLEGQSLMGMLERIDSQQRELQQLRGEVEELRHQAETLRERQRTLYLDTDRRLSRFEREGGVPSAAATPTIAAQPAPEPASATAPVPAPAAAVSPETATPAADPAAEREAYQAAFDILRELRYEQAITAFRDFLRHYPEGRYAHIAQYWLGEANYARRDFRQAIGEYQQLVERFPKSPKVAEALLKIGYSQHELGDAAAARGVLERLLKQYPDTTEAGQADNLIKRLGASGG